MNPCFMEQVKQAALMSFFPMISGKNSDGIIYYQKTVKKDFGSYYTIRIEYPESEKDFGDQYIKYYIKRFPEQI